MFNLLYSVRLSSLTMTNLNQMRVFFCFFSRGGGGGGGGTRGLRPFQEYFTYIELIVHQRWAKTGEPGGCVKGGGGTTT